MNTHMKRYLKVTALLALALGAAVLSGCASQKAKDEPVEMKVPKVWGYVTGEKFAQLDVADQPGVDTLVVKRVLAPTDAWIVVHLDDDGMPGDRVGFKHIPKGESRDVQVPLSGVTSEKVIVAVHADKGMPDELEFDMMNKMQSPDRPFFVNDKELAKAVVVKADAVGTEDGQGAMEATGQPGATGETPMDGTASPDSAPAVESPTEEPATGDSSMNSDSSKDSAMADESAAGAASGEEDMTETSEKSSPAWTLLGGFVVLNAIIIAYAAGYKRASAKAKSEAG